MKMMQKRRSCFAWPQVQDECFKEEQSHGQNRREEGGNRQHWSLAFDGCDAGRNSRDRTNDAGCENGLDVEGRDISRDRQRKQVYAAQEEANVTFHVRFQQELGEGSN